MWWDVSFAAGAATSALFAPGSFQQGGWSMAVAVAVTAFVFSMTSFAAYCGLTALVCAINDALMHGRLQWKGSDGSGASSSACGVASSESAFRSRGGHWGRLQLGRGGSTSAAEQPRADKKKQKKQLQPQQPCAVPEAALIVHVVTGSELLTRCFECVQFAQLGCAFILKIASAVDLVYLFIDASSPSSHPATAPVGVWRYATSMLATGEGMSVVVFGLVLVLCLLPAPSTYQRIARASDLTMIALQIVLLHFLSLHAFDRVWGAQAGESKALHHAAAGRVPENAGHYSEAFNVHQRFYFACAATLTSFLPHVATPAIFRGPMAVRELPARCTRQTVALFAQLMYFVCLGVAYDTVLPIGRATSRLAVFNFVDYRTWLPDADQHAHVVHLFALIPLLHVLSTSRGLLDSLVGLALRILPIRGVVPSDAVTRKWLTAAMCLVLVQLSITQRPLYALIFSNCLLHLAYLAMYLYVWRGYNSGGGSATVSGRRVGGDGSGKRVYQLLGPRCLSTDVVQVGMPGSHIWFSRPFMWLAMCFWAVVFLYWIS